MYSQLNPLINDLPRIKKIETSIRTVVKGVGTVMKYAAKGVQDVMEEVTSCFAHGQLVYAFDAADKRLEEIPIE